MIVVTIEIKLRFQIPPAWRGRGLKLTELADFRVEYY